MKAADAPASAQETRRLLFASQFEEPLIASGPTSSSEDEALFHAVSAYKEQTVSDDFRVLDAFLSANPRSGWRVALLTNLGLSYYHYGYFSKAMVAWEQAWRVGVAVTEPRAKALVDRAFGELIRMHARLGHADKVEALLKEIEGRPVSGSATEAVDGAKQGLWMMRHDPGVAYLCGPMALKNLLLSQHIPASKVSFLDKVQSGTQGVSFAQVAHLATQADFPHDIIYRRTGQPIPVPSIVHWKVTHFAAIVSEVDGRFHVLDPTFGQDLWITRAAIDSEASGYFLVPRPALNPEWRRIGLKEAESCAEWEGPG